MSDKDKAKREDMVSCLLSILDSLKLYDNDSLELFDGTLSQMMFRKMKAYNIDLNKELGFTHLEPIIKQKKINPNFKINEYGDDDFATPPKTENWDDAYKNYEIKALEVIGEGERDKLISKEEFIERIKTDDEFANRWKNNKD
jgi:hypothetical protein